MAQFYPWFNFFLCFKLIIIDYHTLKQRKRKLKPRIKLNHNIYMCFIYLQVFCFKLNKPISDQYNHMTAVWGVLINDYCLFVCGGKKKGRFTEKGSQVTVGPRTSDKLNLIR